jgi:thiamine monophosphate kinase
MSRPILDRTDVTARARNNPTALNVYAQICGETLARSHARAGDPVAIAGYLGRGDVFDRALARFAEAYADQNERDYKAMIAAVDSGRIVAHTGV